jgi:hypothetical protein
LQTQLALNESSAAQQRLNMELGAQLDRTNAEFFTGQDVRRYQAQGTEERLGIATTGEQQRLGYAAAGEQERLTQTERFAGETGLTRTRGEEERRGITTTGEQQRETIGRGAQEQRMTDLQQEMFRRYKEDRDYTQAQRQYRT